VEIFERLESKLLALEQQYVERLTRTFVCTPRLDNCITGQVQFASIDPRHAAKQKPLPVVVLIGINYTQKIDVPYTKLTHYLGSLNEPRVTQKAGCFAPAALAIAAYNRNAKDWVYPQTQLYDNCQIMPYGAANATLRSELTDTDGDILKRRAFHLIVTNFCPFITRLMWQDQTVKSADECSMLLQRWSSDEYLDDLYGNMGDSVDLWIGHASKGGTRWVWPRFMDFVRKHEINEWMLTPNISGPTYANFSRWYRCETNKLFPLFGPEKTKEWDGCSN
jgi:hypothetical protein